jgi:hypothetical protein
LTSISISEDDERALRDVGTLIYYSAHVQMDWFWQHIIQRRATNDGHAPSQERIFRMTHKNKLLRMTYDEFNDAIYCKLETINIF